MKADQFRAIALSLPETCEGAHMRHPDFRVGGKIFATLGYSGMQIGVVMLSPQEQAEFVRASPKAFAPVKGAWGQRGCTQVRLDAVDDATVRSALVTAWRRKAPRRLVRRASDSAT